MRLLKIFEAFGAWVTGPLQLGRPVLVMNLALLLVVGMTFSGCATLKRWNCEGKNWYDIGYNTAMQGERLDSSPAFQECKRVEGGMDLGAADKGFKVGMARYCSPDTAFEYGRNGGTMNFEFCDHPKVLQARYQEGVRAYCEPTNALAVGRSGKVMRDVCPNEMKAGFVTQYRKGRKEYLQTTIISMNREIEDLNYQINQLEEKRRSLSYEINLLPRGMERVEQRVYDPQQKAYIEREVITEDGATASKRKRLASEMESISRSISSSRDDQQELRRSIRSMEDELQEM